MTNKLIEESLIEAKNYVNQIDELGESGLNIADRILSSCKLFIDKSHLKELEDFENKVNKDYEEKMKEAREMNDKEKDTYMKYLNMAQYVVNSRLEKTQLMINFLHKLNQKV